VEVGVPFWVRVVVPVEDIDNWECKLSFKFYYVEMGDVNVYGSDRY